MPVMLQRPSPARRRFDYADTLALHCQALKLPAPVREYGAIPGRRFRLDLAWPDRWLFAEVDGGEVMAGRHNRAAGMLSDCEKVNLLTLAGWRGFRFVGLQVRTGAAINVLEQWFRAHP